MNYTIVTSDIDAVEYETAGTSQIVIAEDPNNTGNFILPFAAKYVNTITNEVIIKNGLLVGTNNINDLPVGQYNLFILDGTTPNPQIVQTAGSIIRMSLPANLVRIINVIP